jgi:hypothetical protein
MCAGSEDERGVAEEGYTNFSDTKVAVPTFSQLKSIPRDLDMFEIPLRCLSYSVHRKTRSDSALHTHQRIFDLPHALVLISSTLHIKAYLLGSLMFCYPLERYRHRLPAICHFAGAAAADTWRTGPVGE